MIFENSFKRLRKIISASILVVYSFVYAQAQVNPNHVWVNGYTRSDGTYVRGHYRTRSNQTVNDNFSTIGNANPYTGQPGWIPRESALVYDAKLDGYIPESYIYKSEYEFKQKMVEILNMWSYVFRNDSEAKDLYPTWYYLDGCLNARITVDVWEIQEEYFAKTIVKSFIHSVNGFVPDSDLNELLLKLDLDCVVAHMNNNSFQFKISDLKHFNTDIEGLD